MPTDDELVAAHLAAALIQSGEMRMDIKGTTKAEVAASVYFKCLNALREARNKQRQGEARNEVVRPPPDVFPD